MLNATTAYTKTKEAKKELDFKRQQLVNKEINTLEIKINSMISQGKFQLEVDSISNDAKIILKDHGYGIKSRQSGWNESVDIIYWEPMTQNDELSDNKG